MRFCWYRGEWNIWILPTTGRQAGHPLTQRGPTGRDNRYKCCHEERRCFCSGRKTSIYMMGEETFQIKFLFNLIPLTHTWPRCNFPNTMRLDVPQSGQQGQEIYWTEIGSGPSITDRHTTGYWQSSHQFASHRKPSEKQYLQIPVDEPSRARILLHSQTQEWESIGDQWFTRLFQIDCSNCWILRPSIFSSWRMALELKLKNEELEGFNLDGKYEIA